MKHLEDIKEGDLITFTGSCISWNTSVYTVGRVTEKAILIGNEWLPKSQIVSICLEERKHEVHNGSNSSYPFDLVTVSVPELNINSWFDKLNNSKRKKVYGF